MSSQTPGAGSGAARPATNGVVNGSVPGASQTQGSMGTGSAAGAGAGAMAGHSTMSPQNLNQIVIEYLAKKGYNRTEAMLRTESARHDAEGRPIARRAEDDPRRQYQSGMDLLLTWIEGVLDIYKPELRRLPWPVFVYSFLELIKSFYTEPAKQFFTRFKDRFEEEHRDDINALSGIGLPEHLEQSEIAKIYLGNKYRLTLSSSAYYQLVQFLEQRESEGGSVINKVVNSYIFINAIDRASDDKSSLANMLARSKIDENFPAEDEGIPGHNPGSAYRNQAPGATTLTRLKLGALPMEPTLLEDVMAELEEEDTRNPPSDGKKPLVQEFQQMIKKEDNEENNPNRDELVYPESLQRDVVMEVHKVKENRDRYKIESQSGGVAGGVSVCMWTFHNSHDSVTCLQFSDDNRLVAIGTDQHYVRVWNVDGTPLKSAIEGQQPQASRRLIGHSGPIYNLSFSPSIDQPERSESADPSVSAATNSQYLLSCSADKSIRLWSLELWQCLVVYKGHMGPIWDITWGPFGYYFVTGSHDKTARLWNSENISCLRMFVGHDQDVDVVVFHPNSLYVFTASSDKTVRMWLVTNGQAVRMFTGHTTFINALACSPSGKVLASADESGTIILWDLYAGRLIKRMKGHGYGGVYSLSWSVESNVLISGGADGTVRVWDTTKTAEGSGQSKIVGEGGTGTKINVDGQAQGGKKKRKENVVSADQIGAFPTKKSPVLKVKFTRMNLAMAAGHYQP